MQGARVLRHDRAKLGESERATMRGMRAGGIIGMGARDLSGTRDAGARDNFPRARPFERARPFPARNPTYPT